MAYVAVEEEVEEFARRRDKREPLPSGHAVGIRDRRDAVKQRIVLAAQVMSRRLAASLPGPKEVWELGGENGDGSIGTGAKLGVEDKGGWL